MQSVKTPAAIDDSVTSVWSRIRAHLESRKERIYREISEYPTPIPRCDQQFNYLLEERELIARELDQVNNAAGKEITHAGAVKLIEDFLASTAYVEVEEKRKIRSLLAGAPHVA
jgi:sugar-specific transcriptional regulator TrmB